MKNLYLSMLAVWAIHVCYGQSPINASDLNTTLGTEFKQYSLQGDFAGSPGIDQVWDFTDMVPSNDQNAATFEYGSTGAESNYPSANTVISVEFDSNFQFYQIDEEGYLFYGTHEEGGPQIIYSDPSTYCIFPIEMGAGFQDEYIFSYTVEGETGEAFGNYEAEVDGYGTLQLPWGDIPLAYRVHGNSSQMEDIEVGGQEVTAFYDGTFTSFFAPGYPGPVLQVRAGTLSIPAIEFEQVQEITTYLGDFEFLGLDKLEVVDELNVFPNPSQGQFTLTFESKESRNISLDVLDIQGRVVYAEGAIGGGFGSVRHTLDLSGLNPGFYLLRLSDGERFEGRKIQVVR